MSWKGFRHRVTRLLATILIAYVLVLLIVRIFESHFVFFPSYPGRLSGDWHPRGLPVEDVWFTSSDGTRLNAWWIPNERARFTFVAFHGNAANIANRADIYRFLANIPVNVLALEYRGYGRSEGKPSEAGIYNDAAAAYQYLIGIKHIPPQRIISYGQSLGTAVAVQVAMHHQFGGLVLEAPFPSASKVAKKVFWFLPGLSLLVESQLATASRMKSIHAPVFIVHCTQDPVIPYEFGKEVYDAANEPKFFLRVDGYCHEEAAIIAPDEYRAELLKFLASLEEKSSPE